MCWALKKTFLALFKKLYFPFLFLCDMYISWWVYFVRDLSYVLQQPSTAWLAKTKSDTSKKELSFLLVLLNTLWITCEKGGAWENENAPLETISTQCKYRCRHKGGCLHIHHTSYIMPYYVIHFFTFQLLDDDSGVIGNRS